MNKKEIDEFEQIQAQLQGFYTEVSNLAKKKPDDSINLFKLKLINQIIKRASKLLAKNKPFADFDQFETDNLPSNSDVLIIVSQYLSSLEKLRADNIEYVRISKKWFWILDGEISDIQTSEPKKIKN